MEWINDYEELLKEGGRNHKEISKTIAEKYNLSAESVNSMYRRATRKGKTQRRITINKNLKELQELKELKKKEEQFNEIIEAFQQKGKFELHKIYSISENNERETIPIIQHSDDHIDEVVLSDSVMGLNEYNFEIAKQRQDTFYSKTVKLITHHQIHYNIKQVVMIFGGDSIGGWIHDELSQTNSMSPMKAIQEYKNMTISGLKYLHDNLNIEKITVVMICGNHSRNTKKVQFANFSETNHEYFMFCDIKNICEMLGLTKFEFIIPEAEMTVIEILGKRILVAHGHQFKYAGGVGGIFPSMLRWFGQVTKALKVDIAFIGHWHQSIFTKRVVVNGSMKGYDAYAFGKGLEFERPSQNMTLLDSEYDFCLFQPIYV